MRYCLLFLVPLLAAQNSDPWKDLREKSSGSKAIQLRLLDPHVYRQRELIRAEHTAHQLQAPGEPPPDEMWTSAGLVLDPPGECGTLANPCYPRNPRSFSGLSGPSEMMTIDMGAYLPPGLTGRFRVALLSRKQIRVNKTESGASYTWADPPQYAVSNTVEIQIIPTSAAWINETIAKSKAVLEGPSPTTPEEHRAFQNAAEQLAFLDDPAAWAAALDLLAHNEVTLLQGLAAATPAKQVCGLMLARVSSPTQSVSGAYLNRLAEICARGNLPPAPSTPVSAGTRPAVIMGVIRLGNVPMDSGPYTVAVQQPPAQVSDWLTKYNSEIQNTKIKAAAALAASLPEKRPDVRPTAVNALLEYLRQSRSERPGEPDPSWIAILKPEIAREFEAADVHRKMNLLSQYFPIFDAADVATMAESVMDAWKSDQSYEAQIISLRILDQVAPERARKRILAELQKSKTWLDPSSLELLPPGAAVPMDDQLIEALEKDQLTGGWRPPLRMAALARFATPQALPRIKRIYESQANRCQPELMAYFVRVEPDYAERVFHSHPWDMHAAPPMCTLQYFNRTSRLAMGKPLEDYLTAYLMHSDVHVKTTAARALALDGTPDALPKLWAVFRYFHEYWKGKGAELAVNGESAALEVELRNAIARGRGWLAKDTDLREIQSLCVSKWCADETQRDLESWRSLIPIDLTDLPYGLQLRIAQYQTDRVEGLKMKLEQFPMGTRFTLRKWGLWADKLEPEIRQFATAKGFVIQ